MTSDKQLNWSKIDQCVCVYSEELFFTPSPTQTITEIVEISSSDQTWQKTSSEYKNVVMEKFTDLKTDALKTQISVITEPKAASQLTDV